MVAALRAVVFGVWAIVHPGPLPPDADPIATALVEATIARADEAPALGSHALDLATMAFWAEHESRLHLEPVAVSEDARAGQSCGILQEDCTFVRMHSLKEQAERWLQLLRWGARVCPSSPAAPLSSGRCSRGRRLADWRTGEARAVLGALLNPSEE
jgi:hypothetical protein